MTVVPSAIDTSAIDAYVGGKVGAARIARGLSQTALGDAIGLSFQQIQSCEKGALHIGADRLCEIAKVLGVPVTSFFEGAPHGEAAAAAAATGTALDLEILRHLSRAPDEVVKQAVLRLIRTAPAGRAGEAAPHEPRSARPRRSDQATPGRRRMRGRHFAHAAVDRDPAQWQNLAAHLRAVSALAAVRAEPFGAGRLAALAGLLHDLGKYGKAFQTHLLEGGAAPDHVSAGVQEVLRLAAEGPDGFAVQLAAFCIAGHHDGLPDRDGHPGSLAELCVTAAPPLAPGWRSEIAPDAANLFPHGFRWHDRAFLPFQLAMLGRMVFSCLVDADIVDAEQVRATARGEAADPGAPGLPDVAEALAASLDAHVADGLPNAEESSAGRLPDAIAGARAAAARPRGVFSLTAPAGTSRTLAALGFALDHARHHGMARIVHAAPAALDGTAALLRTVLGEEVVLEHAMTIEAERPAAADTRGLVMEDWAAPVVATSHAELFESLFAASPARCRRLHRLAGTVILLEEPQAIALPVLRACVAALEELTLNYGCTVVLCAGVPPALAAPRLAGGLQIGLDRSLAPPPATPAPHAMLRLQPGATRTDNLLAALATAPQALVVVNGRRQAQALYHAGRAAGLEGLLHLSAGQVAADRQRTLAKARRELAAGRPCRLVATCLVEMAGALDFPLVWRAEAGLDRLLQATALCNRDGRRPARASLVTVFRPAGTGAPPELEPFVEAMRQVARRHEDLLSPEAMAAYLDEAYGRREEAELDRIVLRQAGAADRRASVLGCFTISTGQTRFAYRSVADAFRLDEGGLEPVIVAAEERAQHVLAALAGGRLQPGEAARALQPHLVAVPAAARRRLVESGHVAFVDPARQFAVLRDDSLYCPREGLLWWQADGQDGADVLA
ncbi:CRISPR-associated endonuclease Cas3'' [Labrys wisconsinensis]|uniref:CRISPR-associated endonuclease/helicase Cas3 n=1 Tax=Labrys wisconsinensis TaxID=425677 RepID=A0ABU0JGU4_9HYPH|nr:CRISPR-associated endonuclease Cas3'' [Labrys wisconsinensis]MDQ0473514.1 CRISPR-associated endonuclease/helicase Cas3 [Labrys wisconsinensis]